MEKYFEKFRKNIVGINHIYESPYGQQKIIYADWIASGRLYAPIEERIFKDIGPFVGNTHTETSETGTLMTRAYHHAQQRIKKHVNASDTEVLINTGNGMTGAIVKFQRILGLKYCGQLFKRECLREADRPVVFITHMEHHSNQTSWFETVTDVVVLKPDENLLVNPDELQRQLDKYKDRKLKIGSFTACSNVTGIHTPYHELARIMHKNGGLCFVDFAASAPYCEINMNPEDPLEKLDAIFFSPHKFLGGPGASGVLIFDKSMYRNPVPDQPGGGTVDWTNPWGEYKYVDNIEAREDGGTPGFLQAIRAALAIELKENMGVDNICKREEYLLHRAFNGLEKIPGIHILADNVKDRIGVLSFFIDDIHYNLIVKLLSDRYGIQARGGCACAGTYGHYLLDVSYEKSKAITEKITSGDLSEKPGWVRISLHPVMKDAEIDYIIEAVAEIAKNYAQWLPDYTYNRFTNEYQHINDKGRKDRIIKNWLKLE
jgi:selenocysteine lyase/cysteine desulfurase